MMQSQPTPDQQQQQPQQGPPPGQQQSPVDNGGLPPQYKAQVKQIASMGMTVIYGGKFAAQRLPSAYKKAQGTAQHPEDVGPMAVADVSVQVFALIDEKLSAMKKAYPPVIALGAIGDIVKEVTEVAAAAGVCELDQEGFQVAAATAVGEITAEMKRQGRITDEELQEAATALQQANPREAEAFMGMIEQRAQRQTGQQAQPDNEELGMLRR